MAPPIWSMGFVGGWRNERLNGGERWHRPHPRAVFERQHRAFRLRVAADQRVPAYAKYLLRHCIDHAHSRDINRLTAAGDYQPSMKDIQL